MPMILLFTTIGWILKCCCCLFIDWIFTLIIEQKKIVIISSDCLVDLFKVIELLTPSHLASCRSFSNLVEKRSEKKIAINNQILSFSTKVVLT